MDKIRLTKEIKRRGLELGFSKVGITTADDFTEFEAEIRSRPEYEPWTDKNMFLGPGSKPRSFYPEAKSIVCAAFGFADVLFPEELDRHVARAYLVRAYRPVANYSCGIRVSAFRNFLESLGCKIYSGDIRIPDRAACARAGITTYGRNTFAYTENDGSFIILYTFIIDVELLYDKPTVECKCPPDCSICRDVCPTSAIKSPGKLLPQNCMLYLNRLNDYIPAELRDGIGVNIHGCDNCQKSCPRNKKILKKAARKDPFLEELKKEFDLENILYMEENDEFYKDVIYPIMNTYNLHIDLFRRNAAIALGNKNNPAHLPALKHAAKSENPIVREAAEWAINKLAPPR